MPDEDMPRVQMGEPLNWARITRYAILMFLIHFSIGLAEGMFVSAASDKEALIRQTAIGLVIMASVDFLIFAQLACRQRERRLQHAALVFLLMSGIAQAFSVVIGLWLPSTQPALLTVLYVAASMLGALLGTLAGYLASARR
ncbi:MULTISPECIES: hypothetical protein [unclassified Pseudoxanthomonas]|uniref:hypothetical protein n=1 Tax=unclassified Pseudoxanthomonas TaxID=2645906 RepID=UPI001620A746|nr:MULTISPECIES: hypothetical protein [unclassified Pseudoxanthomonas]MBB3276692.1 cytochrome c biogenesis protein CcdA [Pseudoxanthomonas sp. OG2]MBV7472235.1 hypothetical protein [Pseudoxanthomonas sp. PXM05]